MELFKYSVAFLVLILASDVLARPSVFRDLSTGSAGGILDPLGLFRPAEVGGGNVFAPGGSLAGNQNPGGLLGIGPVSRYQNPANGGALGYGSGGLL